MKILHFTIFLICIAGCTPDASYRYVARDTAEIPASLHSGSITNSTGSAIGSATVTRIDNASITTKGQIRLSPGPHTITLSIHSKAAISSATQSITFSAIAGEEYRFSGKGDDEKGWVYLQNRKGNILHVLTYSLSDDRENFINIFMKEKEGVHSEPAVLHTHVRIQDQHIPNKQLSRDETQDIEYDYAAVCKFAEHYINGYRVQPYERERMKTANVIEQAGSSDSPPLYRYESNNMTILYTKLPSGEPEIWEVSLLPPSYLRYQAYFLYNFSVKNVAQTAPTLELGCDGIVLQADFKDENVTNIRIKVHSGVI